MKADQPPPELDVSGLPSYAFGPRSMMWWGTAGLMVVEGTVFAIAVLTYFYLRSHASLWPPSTEPPLVFWSTVNTVVLLASLYPNQLAKRAAERQDLARARSALLACLVFSVVFLVIRVFEFQSLNVSWDTDAYGSAIWTLLGLHTVHLITDTVDTAVLVALLFTGPLEGRRFVDVSENALYWYFVVLSWLPIYFVIYWSPRWR
jgi:cytochrome c oxidase subunit 3